MTSKYTILIGLLAMVMPSLSNCGEFDDLVENSPFDGRSSAASTLLSSGPSGMDADVDYELRGVLIINQDKLFNIFESKNDKFSWVKQGDKTSDITIESFDAKNQTLHFYSQDGEKHMAKLKNHINDIRKLGILFEK